MRPNRSLGWSATAIGLLAVLLLGAWVTRSSIFDARSITVRGNRHLTRSAVLAAAGVDAGSNLVWFSPGRTEARLEANPWVASAHVSRSLPSTLAISIQERTAIAVVVEERRYLVAADRTVLGPADAGLNLPIIEVAPGRIRVGAALPSPVPGLLVLEPMTAALRGQVREVTATGGGVLVVELRDGATVVYGDAAHAAEKARALMAVLRWARIHDTVAERIDLRVPSRPALLPEGTVVPVS